MFTLNQDVWFHIVVRMRDTTLLKLTSIPLLWNELLPSLKRDSFWYERTKIELRYPLQCRQDADWKIIYYTARERSIDYMPSLLVQIEMGYDPLIDRRIWTRIASVEVLTYLTSIGLESDYEGLIECLVASSSEGREEMVAHLLQQPMLVVEDDTVALDDAIEAAIRGDHQGVVALLLTTDNEDFHSFFDYAIQHHASNVLRWMFSLSYSDDMPCSQIHELVSLAIKRGDTETLEVVLDEAEKRYPGSILDTGDIFFDEVIEAGKIDSLRLLIEIGIVPTQEQLRRSIEQTIPGGNSGVVRYLLELYEGKKLKPGLLLAAYRTGRDMFKVALGDKRISIEVNLASLLSLHMAREASSVMTQRSFSVVRTKRRNEESINLLVHDPRFDVRSLDKVDIRLLVWCLQDSIADNVNGFIQGGARAGATTLKQLSEEIEEDSIYSTTLRYVILKRPSALQLVRWMTSTRHNTFILASRSVVDESSSIVAPDLVSIRALMLSMLYPTMDLDSLLHKLGEVSQQDRIRAARLVGAWMGHNRIIGNEL